jgi:hypothetical protein
VSKVPEFSGNSPRQFITAVAQAWIAANPIWTATSGFLAQMHRSKNQMFRAIHNYVPQNQRRQDEIFLQVV